MNQKETIINILENDLDNNILVKLWNDYCEDTNSMDDYIYENVDYILNDMFNSIDEALRAACYGSYNYTDDYFRFNGYGNLESFDTYDVTNYMDLNYLADYLIENGCDEISDSDLYQDVEDNFREYFNSKFNDLTIDDDFDLSYYDLITEDWDVVCESIKEDLSEEDEDSTEEE